MMTVVYKMNVLLPWPMCWEQMQWEMAAWVAEHGECAHVQVVWNEVRLNAEVAATEFQSITTDFNKALHQRLGDGCQWQFEKQGELIGHRLILGKSAAQGT
jgi:hypothetical protein